MVGHGWVLRRKHGLCCRFGRRIGRRRSRSARIVDHGITITLILNITLSIVKSLKHAPFGLFVQIVPIGLKSKTISLPHSISRDNQLYIHFAP